VSVLTGKSCQMGPARGSGQDLSPWQSL